MSTKTNPLTFGVIVGNRGFFPDELARVGRINILKKLEALGHAAVCPNPEQTKHGAVETLVEARVWAELVKAKKLDGVIVYLPNFGDEGGVFQALDFAGLKGTPILVVAEPDDIALLGIETRRDSWCGKKSVCSYLANANWPFSLTMNHCVAVESEEFDQELAWFAGVCRTVNAVRKLRIGAVGARPGAFRTVRYSERLFQNIGVNVDTLDLSELLDRAKGLTDAAKIAEAVRWVQTYVPCTHVDLEALERQARLALALGQFQDENQWNAMALQCWTALEFQHHCVPCSVMGMFTQNGIPIGCEVDVPGVFAEYALMHATGATPMLLDWNNNGPNRNQAITFHCSNISAGCLIEPKMGFQAIIAGAVGKENTYGTTEGVIKPGDATYCRVDTDDTGGRIIAYYGHGEFLNTEAKTFGGYGILEVPKLQQLARVICRSGFAHHVAAVHGSAARIIDEAFTRYLGVTSTYWHNKPKELGEDDE